MLQPIVGPIVGIVANPVSARDIRRIVSHAGGLQITERANTVLRILAGLAATGIGTVVMMPENAGIRMHVMRGLDRARRHGGPAFPDLTFLDMPVRGDASDSARAARLLREMDVAAIVVLGGDGTHRVVVAECGNVPIAGVSTGTNNAFPEMHEPTVTGLAVGLAVTGAVPVAAAFAFNKRLEVEINERLEIALVDVVVVKERYVGARAIWRPESFRELFATFGEPGGIGMSSVVALSAPVDRRAPYGRQIRFGDPDTAAWSVRAPIAPGLMETVGIEAVETLEADQPIRPETTAGTLAFDGERELAFSPDDEVIVRLREAAFRTVDVQACMACAASRGVFLTGRNVPIVANHA